jgi:DNA-binding MarR family transcriptional regulator
MDSFDWQRIVARCELSLTTKALAGILASFASRDGSEVRPGEELLADITDMTVRAVREHLAKMRDLGLIERVQHGKTRGRADVYQLTVPGADADPLVMRLDPNWERLTPRKEPKKRAPKPAATGTVVPVAGPVDNPETATATGTQDPVETPVDNSATGTPTHRYRNHHVALPEPGFRPPSKTNQDQPQNPSGLPQPGTSPESDPDKINPELSRMDSINARAAPTADEYAAAFKILMALPNSGEFFQAAAVKQLRDEGIPDPSATLIAVLAAEIAQRPETRAS